MGLFGASNAANGITPTGMTNGAGGVSSNSFGSSSSFGSNGSSPGGGNSAFGSSGSSFGNNNGSSFGSSSSSFGSSGSAFGNSGSSTAHHRGHRLQPAVALTLVAAPAPVVGSDPALAVVSGLAPAVGLVPALAVGLVRLLESAARSRLVEWAPQIPPEPPGAAALSVHLAQHSVVRRSWGSACSARKNRSRSSGSRPTTTNGNLSTITPRVLLRRRPAPPPTSTAA